VVQSLAILAPGLLGASVARAARKRGAAGRIVVWARRPEVRVKLEATGWFDAVAASPSDAARGANLVVICAPVPVIPGIAADILPALEPGSIVTDVGSVKAALCRRIHHHYENAHANFVGAHPMAGSEKTGHEHSSDDLFAARAVFDTPLPETSAAATESVVRFWTALGGEVVSCHPDKHDEIVAHVSHLPQIVASALCSFLSTRDASWRNYAGNGLRDTTRIAGSDAALWRGILEENRHEVMRALSGMQDELQAIQAAMANGDYLEVLNRLERGNAYRKSMRPGKGEA
jgi:prephenate dehydrogenase